MQVTWNKKALNQLDAVMAYGRQEFGERAVQRLYTRIMSYEPLLAANPRLGIAEPLLADRKRAYRSIVVHKLFKLVYYINEAEQAIYIAALWEQPYPYKTCGARYSRSPPATVIGWQASSMIMKKCMRKRRNASPPTPWKRLTHGLTKARLTLPQADTSAMKK